MEYIVIALVAIFASTLTFFSGFGLGTLLLPAFALFFPVEVAVALTGVVHLLNNLFKMALVGKHADRGVVLRFGIPAIFFAILGAWLLIQFASDSEWITYSIGSKSFTITPVGVVIAALMIAFAIFEAIPYFKRLEFDRNKLPLGGMLSGFFGGLSGHQGALRSAFLIKCGLTKEAFIATGVMIASVIDISRISVYFTRFSDIGMEENLGLLTVAVFAAFIGAILGKKLLTKITIELVHHVVIVMIIVLGVLIGLGII
ncbi:MAG: sulfite exporter TauE/SafE family protein [Saprospiraceae bacterium]|nr:sulfite exporter TauE/SafE family protein [Saprospiraceae bacterium]